MNQREIETEIRSDTVWRRPSWPLGSNPAAAHYQFGTGRFRDDFGFEEDVRGGAHNGTAAADTAEQRAFETMDLVPPVNLTNLKARYKELVKQYHPDANGGDSSSEERLKDINEAYTTLKRFLLA